MTSNQRLIEEARGTSAYDDASMIQSVLDRLADALEATERSSSLGAVEVRIVVDPAQLRAEVAEVTSVRLGQGRL